MKILSIDAWNSPDGWNWNSWYSAGTISKEEFEEIKNSNRKVLKYMRDNGYLSVNNSPGKCTVVDDQYNLVICDRNDSRPLFAIEYGSEY